METQKRDILGLGERGLQNVTLLHGRVKVQQIMF